MPEKRKLISKISEINWSKIKVISFDLDDTLWDNTGVIERCQQELLNFLAENHPPIKAHFTVDSMERIAQQLQQQELVAAEEKKETTYFDNMTVLRKAVIKQMLLETNGDLGLINPAFSIFYFWRNQIEIPKVSLEVLNHLKRKFNLVATSNGNSNIHIIGLSHYFDRHLIAGINGQAKPSPDMLHQIISNYEINADELLHIGDNYETDIMGAWNAKVVGLHIDINQIGQLLDVN